MLRLSILFVVVFQISLLAQPNYLMRLANPQQINEKSLDFDIVINSTDSNFILSSYQCSFSFDLKLSPSDSINLEYLDGSSELANFPRNIIGYLNTDEINELIFTSGIGNEIISEKEKLVGKFIITSTEDISVENLNLLWNFSGSVNTILTDPDFLDITVPANHKSFYGEVTNIETEINIPDNFELSQNYPNP
ncbi:MAG: hypothetical protein KDC52_01970, partial [Ignavibacteriae bacterium]|nr:hypothetical protein [Ignavibacteriota bacterium]